MKKLYSNLSNDLNAPLPSWVTLFGIEILAKFEHVKNALSPIALTGRLLIVSGIMASVIVLSVDSKIEIYLFSKESFNTA